MLKKAKIPQFPKTQKNPSITKTGIQLGLVVLAGCTVNLSKRENEKVHIRFNRKVLPKFGSTSQIRGLYIFFPKHKNTK